MTPENQIEAQPTQQYRIRYAPGNGTAYDVRLFIAGNEALCVVPNFEKLRPVILSAEYLTGGFAIDIYYRIRDKMGTDAYGISSEVTARDIAAALVLLMAEHRRVS